MSCTSRRNLSRAGGRHPSARAPATGISAPSRPWKARSRREVRVDFRFVFAGQLVLSDADQTQHEFCSIGTSCFPVVPLSCVLLRQTARKLRARLDVELAERLAQVVLDRARADEELRGDLSICVSLRRKARDLQFLRGELVDRVGGPSAGPLTCRLQLDSRALGEGLHSEVREEVVSDAQLVTRVEAAALPSQPLAVEQMRAREVQTKACRLQTIDCVAVERLGFFPSIQERPGA